MRTYPASRGPSPSRIVREQERERETAGGGLASCFRGGGRVGYRGVVWRRKKYGRFLAQNPHTYNPCENKLQIPPSALRRTSGVLATRTFFFGRVDCNNFLRYLRPFAEQHRSRERERETAGGLEGVEGAERMGWGPKRYVGFCHKIHVPNAIFADFFVSWAGFCGKSSQGA